MDFWDYRVADSLASTRVQKVGKSFRTLWHLDQAGGGICGGVGKRDLGLPVWEMPM